MQGLYDNIQGNLRGTATEKLVGIVDTNGDELEMFPANVLDVNGVDLGIAIDKEEYLQIWNRRQVNVNRAIITGWTGPFEYQLQVLPGQTAPAVVVANPFGSLIDFDGAPIVNNDQTLIGL
jgi:hypothetical protein